MLFKKFVTGRKEASELLRSEGILWYWVSGGRGQAAIITTRPVEGAWPLPREPEQFFEELRLFGELAWRELPNGVIEIAVDPQFMGVWIGKEGRKIRALQEHLRRPVRIIPGIRVFCSPWIPGQIRHLAFKLFFDRSRGVAIGAVFAPWVWKQVEPLLPQTCKVQN